VVALQTIVKDLKIQGNSESKALEDEIVMLAHGFHEMLKKKNFDFKKLPRGQSSKGNKGIKTMSQTLQLTVLSACCGQQGHMMKDY